MRRFIAFGPAFVVLITTLVTLVAAPAAVRKLGYAAADAQIHAARQTLDGDDILERLNAAVRSVAKTVEPSVVHIQWERTRRSMGGTLMAQGSGWVYDTAGHIVTNAHVVTGAPSGSLIVQFYDGRRVPAELVGLDSTTDVAVIRAKTSEGLFPLARGTGEELGQGDRVFAFGSPFGFKFSMSEGIVSGLGRDPATIIGEMGGYTNYIQSDAAVNPGNSGGPLIDVKGRVVGMNVAIATAAPGDGGAEHGQSAGISFAIPLDTIESVARQLITYGAVSKGYLGVSLPTPSQQYTNAEDYNRALIQSAGFRGSGVIVTDVPRDGPAGKAGIQPGDIIVKVNGRAISSVAGLRQTIAVNRPGDPVDVEVYRSGKLEDFHVPLGDLAATQQALRATDEARMAYGIIGVQPRDEGLLIQSLRRASEAVDDGFLPGQIITSIEGKAITSGEDLLTVLAEKGFVNGRRLSVTVLDPEGRATGAGRQHDLTMQYRP